MVPVASGSDAGGSLRNPAAFCNIVGFRPPSAACLIPRLGLLGRLSAPTDAWVAPLPTWPSHSAPSPGPDPNTPLAINEAGELFRAPLDRSFQRRVAWFKNLGGVPFDARVRAVVEAHRATFESLGCIVEQAVDFSPAEISFRTSARGSTPPTTARCCSAPRRFQGHPQGRNPDRHEPTGQDIARAEIAHSLVWRRFQAFSRSMNTSSSPPPNCPVRRHTPYQPRSAACTSTTTSTG